MANEFVHASAGTTLTQSEFEAVGLHVCNSQATGDLIYASSASQLTRLGIGSTNQVLTVIGGVPTWQSTLSGLTFTSPTINGTIATTGLTLPAYTSGAIGFNVASIVLKSTSDASYLQWSGGTDGDSAKITLTGKSKGGDPGYIYIGTPNVALTYIDRLVITGGVNTSVATWSNVTHTGLNITSGDSLQYNSVQVVGARVIDARCDDAVNSGDVTTDGVIDALRDAMITHGLIAAAA